MRFNPTSSLPLLLLVEAKIVSFFPPFASTKVETGNAAISQGSLLCRRTNEINNRKAPEVVSHWMVLCSPGVWCLGGDAALTLPSS